MKLSFSKSDLLAAVQTVQSSISAKSTLPVLSNILIEVKKSGKGGEGKVQLEATDLELGVRSTVQAEVLDEGRVTVPAKKFAELIRELPDGKEIELSSASAGKVELKCGKVRASLVALSPDDFPVIPEFPKSGSFPLSKKNFLDMIRKTCFAVSTDETRHALNGIFFLLKEGQVKMVATDGRRLALISAEADKDLSASAIIPTKTIGELMRLLALGDGTEADKLEVAPTENQIAFRWNVNGDEVALISRVIDRTFPNYEQVIPKSKQIEIKIKTSDIFSAVKRAALFAQDRGGSIRLSFKKNVLNISANAQGMGEEEEELEISYTGADFEIAFNPTFMLDVLKNSDKPEVRFEFTTALNPGLIRPADDDRYLCVIMPVRLQ